MSDITPYNCEAFFLDYHEGNLSMEDTAALFAFLSENPGWNDVFEDFAPVGIDPEHFAFPEKELMKHYAADEIPVITADNCPHFMIAAHEGDLTDAQFMALKAYLAAHPGAEKEYALYGQARLIPEPVVFAEKSGLKKPLPTSVRLIRLWPAALAAAAAVAALLLFAPDGTRLNGEAPAGQPDIAQVVKPQSDVPASRPVVVQESAPRSSMPEIASGVNPPAVTLNERESGETMTLLPALPAKYVAVNQNRIGIASVNRVYTAVYADMMLRWQIEANENRPGLLARLVRPVTNIFGSEAPEAEETLPGRNPLTLWTLAEYSVRGINTITRNNLELRHSRDENGRLVAFALQGNNFKLARVNPTDQKEEGSLPQE
jgi:hypothetical protein